MISSFRLNPSSFVRLLFLLAVVALCVAPSPAQQTLGGITGSVSDSTGGVIPNVEVKIVGEQTGLTRTVKSNGSGEYLFVNLPIGTYTLTYTADGFEVQSTPHITVQADRTATVTPGAVAHAGPPAFGAITAQVSVDPSWTGWTV